MEELKLPEIPTFSKTKIENCRETNDFRPIFFEIYKDIGIVCSMISCIEKNSPGVCQISNANYGVLIGLINRCSRLMLANAVLSSEGKFGETTKIIDRCILETAINVRWICKYSKNNSFERFLVSSLRADLELEKNIQEKIDNRKGKILEIEKRMLESINRCIKLSEIDKDNISEFQRFPTFETRIQQIDDERDDLPYTVVQRIGSHHIHGTWTSLLTDYLEEEDGVLYPRDNKVSIHENQFISISLEILEMLKDFIIFISNEESLKNNYLSKFNERRKLLDSFRIEVLGNDFDELNT